MPDSEWERAFRETPRHVFVDRGVLAEDRTAVVSSDTPGWMDLVYADETLLTQVGEVGDGPGRHGVPTSSSSRPRVMAVMLDRLDIRPTQKILEIGTGTGYNTAILAHRVGPEHVCSVDIDPGLVDDARGRLATLDQRPNLSARNGAEGWAEHGPFDRILATCAISHVPPAWVDQLAEGGRIVAPLDAGESGPLLVLDKTASDEVSGRIDPYPVHFMPMRERADSPLGVGHTTQFTGGGMPHYGTLPRSILRRWSQPIARIWRCGCGCTHPVYGSLEDRGASTSTPSPRSPKWRSNRSATVRGRSSNVARPASGTPWSTPTRHGPHGDGPGLPGSALPR